MKNLENCIKSICNIVVEICNEEIISYNLHFQIVICFYSHPFTFFGSLSKCFFHQQISIFFPVYFSFPLLNWTFPNQFYSFFSFRFFNSPQERIHFSSPLSMKRRKREVLCWTILLYNNSSVWFSFFSIPELILMTKKEEENLSFINEKFYRVYALPLDLIEVFFLSLFPFFPFTN